MVTLAAAVIAELAPLAQRLEEADTREIGPGLLAFTIVVLLAVATFLLVRSMLHHIAKVPPTFDDPQDRSADDVG